MVCHTLDTIRARTKMQVDTFIFLLFCYLFFVYAKRVISMVIVKEIVFTCLSYAVNVYHQSEPGRAVFVWLEFFCDLVRGISTWFQVIGQLVMHISLFEADHKSACFGKACVSCTFQWIVFGLTELQFKFICTSEWMY